MQFKEHILVHILDLFCKLSLLYCIKRLNVQFVTRLHYLFVTLEQYII